MSSRSWAVANIGKRKNPAKRELKRSLGEVIVLGFMSFGGSVWSVYQRLVGNRATFLFMHTICLTRDKE